MRSEPGARIIIEMDPDAPIAYLDEFISFLKNFRWVKHVYLDAKARP